MKHVRTRARDRVEHVGWHDRLDCLHQRRIGRNCLGGFLLRFSRGNRSASEFLLELRLYGRVDPLAGPDRVSQHKTDHDGDRRKYEAIDESLYADTAELANIADARNANDQ